MTEPGSVSAQEDFEWKSSATSPMHPWKLGIPAPWAGETQTVGSLLQFTSGT